MAKLKVVRNKHNTPGIIKYSFWQMTYQNPEATYVCINYGDAAAPKEIAERSVYIDGDIGDVLKKIKMKRSRFSFCYGRCVLMKEIQKSQIAEKATAKMPKIYLPKCRKTGILLGEQEKI